MNVTKISKNQKRKVKPPVKPIPEQRWEGEGGQPSRRADDTRRPTAKIGDTSFPGPQITRILRELLGRMPKPQRSRK